MNKPLSAILAALAFAAAAYPQANKKPLVPTEIVSERFHVENDGVNAHFLFTGSVHLVATNLDLRCDKLEIFAKRHEEGDAPVGEFNAIQKIIAVGNVSIVQEERSATAGRAEVLPNEDKVLLYENPTITQGGSVFTAPVLIFEGGQGRVTAEGGIRFVGPALRDLGFDQDDPEQVKAGQESVPPPPPPPEVEEPAAESAPPTAEEPAPEPESAKAKGKRKP